jgi:hypothetical protein
MKHILRDGYAAMICTAGLLVPAIVSANLTLTIQHPDDGAVINANYTGVEGLAQAIGEGQGVDLMLTLDNSGSLLGTDPTLERFDAVRQLFSSFGQQADIQVGLVFFSTNASRAVALQDISSARPAINSTLNNNMIPAGLTNIAAGIRSSMNEFVQNGRTGASKVILLFTDGEDTVGSDFVAAAQEAGANGHVVHHVCLFTDAAQEQECRKDGEPIAQAGGGQLFLVNQPAMLAALFKNAAIVGLESVSVANNTTGQIAGNVTFGGGSYSTTLDLTAGDNVLEVTAKATDGETKTASVTVTVPGAEPPPPPPVSKYRVKLLPQVLMAGFDPMMLDIGDDSFNIVAVVREGSSPIHHVSLSENTGGFSQAMTLAGQLPNGDKVYTLKMVLPGRMLLGMELSNLFGSGAGEFNIIATDEAQQQHNFPALVSGNHVIIPRTTPLTRTDAYTDRGIRRNAPQVIMAGFDPILLDVTDDSFKITAIVREGATSIRNVTLKTENNSVSIAMDKETDFGNNGDIGNGDLMYSATYTYRRGAFPDGVFENLFGRAYGHEFSVKVIDEAFQEHTFPSLGGCNCPAAE